MDFGAWNLMGGEPVPKEGTKTMWSFIDNIEPQPARGKFLEKMFESMNWVAEEKFDGERRIVQFCGTTGRFTGRASKKTGKPVEKSAQLPHLSAHQPICLDGTVLDGELILPDGYGVVKGGKSKAVTSIANSSPEEAIRKQVEQGWLRYVVFDCLWHKGVDVRSLSLMTRRQYAASALSEWGNPYVSLAQQTHNSKTFLDEVYARGGEGIILKNVLHTYGEKNLWVKMKAEIHADVIITGFEKPEQFSKKVDGTVSETKFFQKGWIGAIKCSQWSWDPHDLSKVKPYLVEVASVSGLPDDLREDMSLHPQKYIGQVIEIEANDREPTGRFRHPRFNQFRDKPSTACVLDLNEK